MQEPVESPEKTPSVTFDGSPFRLHQPFLPAGDQPAAIRRLVVCGLQTDFCIDTTCRRAASLGFKVNLVADAHSTFDRDYITAETVIRHHNRILRDFPAGEGHVWAVPSHQVAFD